MAHLEMLSGIFKFGNYKPSQSASFKAIIQSSFENTKDDFINGDYKPLQKVEEYRCVARGSPPPLSDNNIIQTVSVRLESNLCHLQLSLCTIDLRRPWTNYR